MQRLQEANTPGVTGRSDRGHDETHLPRGQPLDAVEASLPSSLMTLIAGASLTLNRISHQSSSASLPFWSGAGRRWDAGSRRGKSSQVRSGLDPQFWRRYHCLLADASGTVESGRDHPGLWRAAICCGSLSVLKRGRLGTEGFGKVLY